MIFCLLPDTPVHISEVNVQMKNTAFRELRQESVFW